jgi:hypothetical protein
MKILVLVLSANVAPYPALMRTQRETWASVPIEGVEPVFYHGGETLSLDGCRLVLPVSDHLHEVGRKTLAAFEWAVAHRDFDLVFRTNNSSYVDLPNLRRYVDQHGRAQRFYSGFVGLFDTLPFASGSGYFLSRDLVEVVLDHRDRWRHEWEEADDVALADVLLGEGVTPEPAPRVDYRSQDEVTSIDTSQYHFRCRTATQNRRGDIWIMRAIHRAFCDARGTPAPRRSLPRWIRRR